MSEIQLNGSSKAWYVAPRVKERNLIIERLDKALETELRLLDQRIVRGVISIETSIMLCCSHMRNWMYFQAFGTGRNHTERNVQIMIETVKSYMLQNYLYTNEQLFAGIEDKL